MINSGYGLIPLFLSYKFENSDIHGFEKDEKMLNTSRSTGRSNSANITFYKDFSEIPETKVYVIHGNFEHEKQLKDLVGRKAEKVIFIDSDFPNRWLLDLNFEIIYRQNNILVLRKAD